jgi:hypothetical protein
VTKIVTENIARESKLHADENRLYHGAMSISPNTKRSSTAATNMCATSSLGEEGPKTEKVHTNSAEGYFSIFKRGMRGIYQHCAEKRTSR